MAMKKAEMEAHRTTYRTIMTRMRSAAKKGDLMRAVRLAVSAWKHVDGMMQYERRHEGREFDGLECVDTVLKYAPLFFGQENLDELSRLLKEQRRIEKNTSQSLASRLDDAQAWMWDAYHVWNSMEGRLGLTEKALLESSGVGKRRLKTILNAWVKQGILDCENGEIISCYTLVASLQRPVRAKCPACGVIARAPKLKMLTEQRCPRCKTVVLFVLLRNENTQQG